MTYPYTQSEFDAFGWSPLSRSMIDPAETYGLDYDSAREVTPRWFGVSFGDGNDGVSHSFAAYYVKTADPFKLAAAALVASFKQEWKARAAEAMEIDGEADYTISATIYDPLDDESGGYCDANGAWLICEVFPVGDDIERGNNGLPLYVTTYHSLEECFDETDLRLADS